MTTRPKTPTIDWSAMYGPFWHVVAAGLLILIPLAIAVAVLIAPLPGRGPRSRRRDPWRTFKFDARRAVMARAGGRCEGALLVLVGRCDRPAVEADHVYPWSKGGATLVANGQALCAGHNRRKSNMTPPWWYVLVLERRRRSYFPPGADVRVSGALSKSQRASHAPTKRPRH